VAGGAEEIQGRQQAGVGAGGVGGAEDQARWREGALRRPRPALEAGGGRPRDAAWAAGCGSGEIASGAGAGGGSEAIRQQVEQLSLRGGRTSRWDALSMLRRLRRKARARNAIGEARRGRGRSGGCADRSDAEGEGGGASGLHQGRSGSEGRSDADRLEEEPSARSGMDALRERRAEWHAVRQWKQTLPIRTTGSRS